MNENEERIIKLEENVKQLKESQNKSNKDIEKVKENQILANKDIEKIKENQKQSNDDVKELKEKQILTEKDMIEMKNDIKYLRGTMDTMNNTINTGLKDINEKIEKDQLEKLKNSINKEDKIKDKVIDYILKGLSYLLVGGAIYFILEVLGKFNNK